MFSLNIYKHGESIQTHTKQHLTVYMSDDDSFHVKIDTQKPRVCALSRSVTKYRKKVHLFAYVNRDGYLLRYLLMKNKDIACLVLSALPKKCYTKSLHDYLCKPGQQYRYCMGRHKMNLPRFSCEFHNHVFTQ